ncbi:MAG: N-acetylglucosamine-6-phosphate deacetylase [Bifidobacteriaceae bacterium]|jgi:N-acetylglucosamine-6-phosphate deacetylase|nr:N-acetylglucosamine-6-phosphate deacetylase [Bifidobacteriaceae bacterium]
MAKSYAIYADRFFLPSGETGKGYLEVTDGKFGEFSVDKPNLEVLDYAGRGVAPGLIDTHIHGWNGNDAMDASEDGLRTLCKDLLSCGVTSVYPSTLTGSADELDEVCKVVKSVYDEQQAGAQEGVGAKIAGIFFEGPFFTEKYKGAQNPKYFSDPDIKLFDRWQESAGGLIKKIAFAPERKGVTEFVKQLLERNVIAAIGHSAATYAEAEAALNAGATVINHTYNGMSGLSHREPAMAGAAFNSPDDVYAELICDGHHVHPAAVEILIKIKSPEKVVLVTDAMRAGGLPDGDYMLGEFPAYMKDGVVRLKNEAGSLAASTLKLCDAVKNVIKWGAATPADAVKMATATAAKSMGIENTAGSIAKGRAANFVVFSADYELLETYVDGELGYEA